MNQQGLNEFQARVKRIQAPRNNSYYDQELEMHVPKHLSKATIVKHKDANKIGFKSLILSLLIGAVALLVAQVIRVRFLALENGTDIALVADLWLALFTVLIIGSMVRYKRAAHVFTQFAGIAVMMVSVHNLMWASPDNMGIVYSESHVQAVLATTTPRSVAFGDNIIQF